MKGKVEEVQEVDDKKNVQWQHKAQNYFFLIDNLLDNLR